MRVIDSHTAGEPTRVVVSGGPDLGEGTMAERAARLARDHAGFCASVLCEPRGHDAMVGALLVPPLAQDAATGVIFFNTVGNLGMCGHATIGTAVTLAHMGRIGLGAHRFETPVGDVQAELLSPHQVRVANIASYRHLRAVDIDVPDYGRVRGDVAYGGNWFFLAELPDIALDFANIGALTRASVAIRDALVAQGITGRDGAYIDHIELIGPPQCGGDGRNFVLCPGGAYDRSPCGTGSSAKLACLAEDGRLAEGEVWVQESIIDSTYRMVYRRAPDGAILPEITGEAYVTAQTTLLFADADPYRAGIRPMR